MTTTYNFWMDHDYGQLTKTARKKKKTKKKLWPI